MNESMQGKLEDSIFDADQPAPGQKTGGLQEAREGGAVGEPAPPPGPSPFGDPGESLPATATELATDPSPRARVRLQRKLVAQMVRRGSTPATREERIARTERQMTFQSPWMATSVKKLGMLARQISGKTVDDALVQMKFSKKKFAREVSYRLREARDVANVKHGMGLGAVPTLAAEADEGDEAAATTITTTTAKTPTKNAKKEKQDRGRYIQTREGKWITVKDPTRIYIDEVWVNRGPFRPKRYDMKGRGRFGVIRPPSTSESFGPHAFGIPSSGVEVLLQKKHVYRIIR
jgi:ribosomal protein L22